MPSEWTDLLPTTITYRPSDEMLKTGSWRTYKPVIDTAKCIGCWTCWKFCPDAAIRIDREAEKPAIDYDYCKGCGVCANECPVTCIQMIKEV